MTDLQFAEMKLNLYLLGAALFAASVVSARSADAPDILVADFEGKTYGDWKTAGEAFGFGPAQANVFPPNQVIGHLGHGLVNSYLGKDKSTGTLVSPPLRIERRCLNFLIGGGNHSGKTCMNLLCEGKIIHSATGPAQKVDGREVMHWQSWNVSDLAGKLVTLQIVDEATGGWGHINIDQIVQSDTPRVTAAPEIAIDPKTLYAESYRPQFHFSPKTGWMNDPNGLVYDAGEYHLFFQAWPESPQARGKIWSHAVSTDLVHWTQLEHVLLNEGARQIYSGSAVIDHNNSAGFQKDGQKPLVAIYTLTAPSVQCIAWSNDRGRTFTKYPAPVVGTIHENNRDPKVFWHQPTGQWIMVLYLAERGKFTLLGSKNLKEWMRLSDVEFPDGHECPELFELPVDSAPGNTRWVMWEAGGRHQIGRFDGVKFTAESEVLPSEWGKNCYAGQTWNDAPDGRRLFIAWMASKGKRADRPIYPGMPFDQQMTFPRELTLRTTPEGLRLFAQPIREIETLYRQEHRWSDLELKPGENPLAKIEGELFDLETEFEPGADSALTLDVRGTPVTYDASTHTLSCLGKFVELLPPANRVKLRVLVDRTSIELFAQDGRYVMSFCFVADPASRKLTLATRGSAIRLRALKVRELKSIWPAAPGGPVKTPNLER